MKHPTDADPRPRLSWRVRTMLIAWLAGLAAHAASAGPAFAQNPAPAQTPGQAAPAASAGETAALPTFRDERRWSPGKAAPAASTSSTPSTRAPAAGAAQGGPGATGAKSAAIRAPNPALKKLGDAPCGAPDIATAALDAGQMRITIASACRGNQAVVWSYGGAETETKLDPAGKGQITVDCFVGTTTPVDIVFADGTTFAVPVAATDLDKLTKVAVIWRAAVNLDLHAFEYAARAGQAGHVWSGAPSSLEASRERLQKASRGVGYLSSQSRGEGGREHVEVYTHLHKDGQMLGAIAFALDYETRGARPAAATCAGGAQAEVPFRVVTLSRHGQVTQESGLIAAAPCDQALDESQRYGQAGFPVVRLRP